MSKTSFNINPSAFLTTALSTAFLNCAAQVAEAPAVAGKPVVHAGARCRKCRIIFSRTSA